MMIVVVAVAAVDEAGEELVGEPSSVAGVATMLDRGGSGEV